MIPLIILAAVISAVIMYAAVVVASRADDKAEDIYEKGPDIDE